MYILKNRVLSLLITIMLLVSGNMSLFGVSNTEELNVSQKNVQSENDAEVGENEIVEVDLFLIGPIARLGRLLGHPKCGNLVKVRSETIVSEEIDPNALVVSVLATSRDNPKEKQPLNGLHRTAKKGAMSELLPQEWHDMSEEELKKKWDLLTKEEENSISSQHIQTKEEQKEYWRINEENAKKTGRSDDWQSRYPGLPGPFPSYLTLKSVNNLKEGDKSFIPICDDKGENCKYARVTAHQLNYRYEYDTDNKKRNFEEYLRKNKARHVRLLRKLLDKKLIKLGISDTKEGEKQRESLNNKLIELGVLDEEEEGK